MHSSAFETLARMGYVTKGCSYAIIGLLTVLVLVGSGGRVGARQGAVETIAEHPLALVLLTLLAALLLAYAGWRLLQALVDPDHHGTDREGLRQRLGYFLSALAHGSFGVMASQLVLSGASDGTKTWLGRLMSIDAVGLITLAALGASALAVGLRQLYEGVTTRFRRMLKTQVMSRREKEVAVKIGRAGLTARGTVFCAVGVALLHAAAQHDPGRVQPLDETLARIGREPLGSVLLLAVALGVTAYAGHQLVLAKWRRIAE